MKKTIAHHLKKKDSDTDNVLNWLKLHNLFPILLGLFTVFTVFTSLKQDVALNTERLQNLQSEINAQQSVISALQTQQQQAALDMIKLQNGTGIRPSVLGDNTKLNQKISETPTPSPTPTVTLKRRIP